MLTRRSAQEPSPDFARLMREGLAGDDDALQRLVDLMTPVVHVRVCRALRRRLHDARGRDLRQDLEDLTQDVFAALFAKQGKALRAWNADRGLSFLSFVGFLAEREVAMRLRTTKRNPWTEDPTATDELSRAIGCVPSHESQVESRDLLARLLEELVQWLTPEGRRYFQLLYVDERTVSEVAEASGTTADALYAWRSRLLKKVRKLREKLNTEGSLDD